MQPAFPTYKPGTPLKFDISEMAYDLYRQDWIDQHTTANDRLRSIHDYYAYVQECMELDDEPETYEEYLDEYGFSGSIYVCYDEFLDAEYQDDDYITHLLNNDEVLVQAYRNDRDDIDADDDADDIDADDNDADDNENNSDADCNTETPESNQHWAYVKNNETQISFTCHRPITPITIKEQSKPVLYPHMCRTCLDKYKTVLGTSRYKAIACGKCDVTDCDSSDNDVLYIGFTTDELILQSEE